MNEELFAGITVGDLVTAGVILAVGVVLAGITIVVAKRVRKRLRRDDSSSILARLIDDMEEVIAWLFFLIALFQALIVLPPLQDRERDLQNVLTLVGVALVVFGAIRVQSHILDWYVSRLERGTARSKMLASMAPTVRRTTTITLIATGVLVVLDQLGMTIAPLLAGLGIGGLAVALALQGTLTNFFAGLNILTDGAIRVGDYVELSGGLAGYVDQIGWRTTRIRMLSNNMVIIPNASLADSITTNYSYPEDQMSLYLKIGVSYFSNLEEVERITVEVAQEVMEVTPGAVEGYQPSVWYDEFADSNVIFWVVLRARGYMESWMLKHSFMKALFDRYAREGIEISFPNRNIYYRNGPEEAEKARIRDEQLRNAAALEQSQREATLAPGELAVDASPEGAPGGGDVPG